MNKTSTSLLVIASFALLGLTRAHAADAGANWGQYCASCHGKDGAGKTKVGHLMKIQDLTDGQYQKTFTDDDAFKAVKEGYQDKDGNTKMKPFQDKLSDDDTKALIAYIRTLAK